MDFPERESWIKRVQEKLNLLADGKDGRKTWEAILNILNINQEIEQNPFSKKAFDLILKYEIGGGKNYYEKYLQKPTWPKGASGVTIGVGYDLGYNSLSQFEKDWFGKIPDQDFKALKKTLGVRGSNAQKLISSVSHIKIPWSVAIEVFEKSTLPRFIKETLVAFPDADKLHPDAFGALVSLVFNRGSSVSGERRREMLNIRDLVPKKDYKKIAAEIRSMKRLWVGKGMNGLLIRRDEEASLIENCS